MKSSTSGDAESIATEIENLDKAAHPGPWWVRAYTHHDDRGSSPCIAVNVDNECSQADYDLVDGYRVLAPEMAAAWRQAMARITKLEAAQLPRPIAEAPTHEGASVLMWSGEFYEVTMTRGQWLVGGLLWDNYDTDWWPLPHRPSKETS